MKTYWCVMEWKDPTQRVSTGYSNYLEAKVYAEELARKNPGRYFTIWQAVARCTVGEPLPPILWDSADGQHRNKSDWRPE